MIDRRVFVASAAAVLWPRLSARAQPAGKVYRLGVLSPGVRPTPTAPVVSNLLPSSLREMGWVLDQNLVVEHRFADAKPDQLQKMADELVRLQPDVLVAASPIAIQAVKRATKTIPIVMVLAYSDPVELGFVASFARPGGNLTGVLMAAERTMAAKRVELIKAAVPRAARLAVLTTAEPSSRTQAREALKAATALGMKLMVVELREGDYDRAFTTMVADGADSLLLVESVTLTSERERIIELAARHRLPAMYTWREQVEAGGLMAYGGSISALARRVAVYVDRIFRGANPAGMPVERETAFSLVINVKTAKALGLTIPPAVLARADQVIE